ELSGETALKTAADLIASNRAERALVVCADEVVPALEAAFRALKSPFTPGEGAAAVLLTSEPGDVELTSIELSARATPTLRFSEAPAGGDLNPSGGLIRVVRAVERLRGGSDVERVTSFAQGGGEAALTLRRR